MNSPDWEPVEVENLHTNRIVPIYSLTERITQKWLRGQMNNVITYWAPAVVDALPETIRRAAQLVSLGEALDSSSLSLIRRRASNLRVNALDLMRSSTCKWECCARSGIGNRWTAAASLSRTSGWVLD
jgi:RecG-like helicase